MRSYLPSFAIVLLLACGGASAQHGDRGAAVIYGGVSGRYLAVGIDRYAGPETRALRGPESDAALIAGILKGRGLDGDLLVGQAATRAAILARIAAAGREMKPTSTFVLYLAGHGTRGETAAFLPYDYREKSSGTTLTADDLAYALEALPCAHVTAILDAAFCGAMARPSAKVAYVAACAPNEPSLETEFDGKPSGLFTHALLGVLQRGAPSWPEAVAEVRAEIAKNIASKGSLLKQTPAVFGEADARLLGQNVAAGEPLVLKQGDRVRIQGSDAEYTVGANGLGLSVGTKVVPNGKAAAPKVVEVALRYVGTPYVWGGNDLARGIDTSHFVAAVFAKAGLPPVPPPVAFQEQRGKIVHWKPGKALRGARTITLPAPAPSLDVLRPGDRIIIQHPPLDGRSGSRHTGIYIGAYDGRFGRFRHAVVHAGTRGVAVVDLSSLWKDYRYAVRD